MCASYIANSLSIIKEYSKRGDLLIIFFIAVFLRLIFLSQVIDQIGFNGLARFSPDAELYIKTAQSLIGGPGSTEPGLFIFGPGYSSFLALNFLLWGYRISIIIILQILISAASTLLIYKFSQMITASYSISIIAAILFMISYTSITLSISPLSDTLYVFLLLAGIITFLKSLKRTSARLIIASGLLIGGASLTRSIGQFWPLLMILYGWFNRSGIDQESITASRNTFRLAILGAAVAVVISLCWAGRNFIVHDVPAVSSAGAIGLFRIADQTIKNMGENDSTIAAKCNQSEDIKAVNPLKAQHDYSFCYAKGLFLAHPSEMIITYLKHCWMNINEISYFHRALLPGNKNTLIKWEQFIFRHRLNYLNFIICLIGFVIITIQKKYRLLSILLGIYIYFAFLAGLTLWQGSRIFFPGQIAAVILVAYVIVYLYELILKFIRRNHHRGKFESEFNQ
jgi:hypothetical protein